MQRGNVSLSNLQLLNALLYVLEHGCKWRGLPKHFGNCHTIYTRMNRWSKNGVLDRVCEKLQLQQILCVRIELFAVDSTSIKVHPDTAGALKNGPQSIGKSRGGRNTKLHLIAADAHTAVNFRLLRATRMTRPSAGSFCAGSADARKLAAADGSGLRGQGNPRAYTRGFPDQSGFTAFG